MSGPSLVGWVCRCAPSPGDFHSRSDATTRRPRPTSTRSINPAASSAATSDAGSQSEVLRKGVTPSMDSPPPCIARKTSRANTTSTPETDCPRSISTGPATYRSTAHLFHRAPISATQRSQVPSQSSNRQVSGGLPEGSSRRSTGLPRAPPSCWSMAMLSLSRKARCGRTRSHSTVPVTCRDGVGLCSTYRCYTCCYDS